MKRKILFYVILLLSSLLFPQDKDYRKIQAGTLTDYPPFCITGTDGQPDGFAVELLREVCRAANIEVDIKIGEFNIVRKELEEGKIDAVPMLSKTPDRAYEYGFTSPYLTMRGAAFVNKRDSGITSLSDLNDKKIAVLKGTQSEAYITKNIKAGTILHVSSNEDAFNALKNGECDAVVTQKLMGNVLLKEMNISDIEAKIDLDDLKMNFCIGVRKDDPGLLSLINEGLLLVMTNGTYDGIYKKWFVPTTEMWKTSLVIAGDANYPPFSFIDSHQEYTGPDVETTHSIAKELGVLLDLKPEKWSDLMGNFKNGEYDAVQGILFSEERAKYMDFSIPYMVSTYRIFAVKGRKIPKDFSELKNYKVAVEKNNIMHERAVAEGLKDNLIVAESHEEALLKLSAGEADYALLSYLTAIYYIKKHGIKNVEYGEEGYYKAEFCYSVRKGNRVLLNNLNNAIAALETSGRLREIHSKWFGAFEKPEINYKKMILYSLAFLVPLLVLVIVIISWNRTLIRKVEERTKELSESQKIFDEFFEHSPIYVFFKDKDICSLKLSRNYEQMIGRPLDELLNKTMDELFPSELAKKMISDDKKILEEGKPVVLDEELNGRFYTTYKFPIIINGKPEYLAGYTIDVTQNRESQNKIRESEEKYRKMFDNASVGIAVVGLDKKFRSCNATFCSFTGYSENELIGKTIADITHPEDMEIGLKEMKMIIEGKLNYFITQKRYLRKDGVIVWGQINISLVRNYDREPLFFLPVLNDITEMKQAEDQLSETAEELRHMNSFMVDREIKMAELKEEINELLKAAGKPEKY